MITKVLEIRDRNTCIPALAIKMVSANPVEDRFLWRCGYPRDSAGIVLMHLDNQRASSDPYWWDNRTMAKAHDWLYEHFDEVSEGDVIDVRVLLGEADEPAPAEIVTA